jgi:hypothetical protein
MHPVQRRVEYRVGDGGHCVWFEVLHFAVESGQNLGRVSGFYGVGA